MLGRGCSSLTIFLANVGTTPPFTVPGLKLDGTAADGVGIFLTVRVRPPKKTPPKHGLDGPPHGVGETHSPGRPPTGPLNFTSGDGGEFFERLFSPSHVELSFRVSANIAAYLEPPGRGRYICFKKIKALYDSRSKAAHGSGEADLMPYAETYAIARRVLLKMIEDRHVPDRKELEAGLFGDPVGLSPGPPLEQ